MIKHSQTRNQPTRQNAVKPRRLTAADLAAVRGGISLNFVKIDEYKPKDEKNT